MSIWRPTCKHVSYTRGRASNNHGNVLVQTQQKQVKPSIIWCLLRHPSHCSSLSLSLSIYILFFEVFTVHIVGTNCALEWPFEFEFALFLLTNLHKPMGIGKWVLYKDFLGFQKVLKILCEPLNGAWVWDSGSYDIYPMYPTWAREPGTKLWTPLLNFWGLGPFSWYIIISLGPHSDPSRRGSRWDDTYCNFFFFH